MSQSLLSVININRENESKILHCFIHREKVYSEESMKNIFAYLSSVKDSIITKKKDMEFSGKESITELAKNTAKHFCDNYDSQLKNIAEIEKILTTEP